MKRWNVRLNGKFIDSVSYDASIDKETVRKSLIDHDGFDPYITVAAQRVKKEPCRYIQRKGQGYLETVDEFSTYKEAMLMVKEYRISDHSAEFYISSRACKDY